jgi:hypothetical protein
MSDKILGWSEGRSNARFGDGTGIFHLILCESKPGHAIAYAACNRNLTVMGGLEETKRGHKCKRCEAIAKRLETIPVVFRVWIDYKDAEVFALFPTDFADSYGNYCGCYQHVGQYCSAYYHHCIRHSRPATPKEYADLKTELERIGYTLRVIQRASPIHHEARRQQANAFRIVSKRITEEAREANSGNPGAGSDLLRP